LKSTVKTEEDNPLFEQRMNNALDGLQPYYYDHLKNRISKTNATTIIDYIYFITAGEIYYDEVRSREGDKRGEEEQYCIIERERFLRKPISNVDLVKRIKKMMMMRESS
jgi:hypothetical protein